MGLKQYNIDALHPLFTKDDTVIFGVLNWGLGHASRSIPMIEWLHTRCKRVIIASDGVALEYLQMVFPDRIFEVLPAYGIHYKYENITLNISLSSFSIVKAIIREKKVVKELVEKYKATKVISDNRLGFHTTACPCFYITHQLKIIHQNNLISYLGSELHRYFYNKFDKIFVPDFKGDQALCPDLSDTLDEKAIYIGPVTRIGKLETEKSIDVLVILSGPEPQRTKLEKGLLKILNELQLLKVRFVRGTSSKLDFEGRIQDHIEVNDITNSQETEFLLNSCKMLISRSGYSTIMDTYELKIPTIWIPTPGQTEQEYLADFHQRNSKYQKLNQNELNKLQKIIISMI